MKYRIDPGTFAGLLIILAVAIAAFLLALGMRAHAQELGEDFTKLLQKEIWRWQSCPVGGECRQTRVELDDGTILMWAREQFAGQFDNIDPATREWFKSVKSKNGVPCCDIADGHKTAFKVDSDGHFFVPLNVDNPDNPWIQVPPDAVVYDAGNPYEEAVVWYHDYGAQYEEPAQRYYIRCFVPVGGV